MTDTLDPEEIRCLPMRRDLPYNGLTREQVIAIGGDPDVTEALRIEGNQRAQQTALQEAATAARAVRQAVDEGQLLPAEGAALLLESGQQLAHDLYLKSWQASTEAERTAETNDLLALAGPDEWLDHLAGQRAEKDERKRLEQEAETQKSIEAAVAALNKQLDGIDAPKPVRDQVRALAEQHGVPTDEAGQRYLIEQSLDDVVVDAQFDEQVNTEWRIHRKMNGSRDGLVTAGDVARAEAAFKTARKAQLVAESQGRRVPVEPTPTAQEESEALVADLSARTSRETERREHVASIGTQTEQPKDLGEAMTARRNEFQNARQRAEEGADDHETDEAIEREKLKRFGPQFEALPPPRR